MRSVLSSVASAEAQTRGGQKTQSVDLELAVGDLTQLTDVAAISTGKVDRFFEERTWQHISKAALPTVLQQVHSLLANGGRAVVVEPNWELFTVRSPGFSEVSHALQRYWADSFNNGSVALDLQPLLEDAGFIDTAVQLESVQYRSFDSANLVYDLERTVDKMATEGHISREDADGWLAEQKSLATGFNCTLMMAIVSGQKASPDSNSCTVSAEIIFLAELLSLSHHPISYKSTCL